MSIFKPSTWGISQVYQDFDNYRNFVRIIKAEKAKPLSKFNKWKLNTNYFYTIYFTMDIEDIEDQLPEHIKRLRIIETLAPLHRYLDEELGFAGSLVPEFNQFFDDEGNATLTYLIAYRYAFDKFSLGWVLRWAGLFPAVAILTYTLVKNSGILTDTIPTIIQWLQTLI